MRAWLLALLLAGCGSSTSFTGSWAGDFFIALTPTPLVGNPSGTGTATLTQDGSMVRGSFDVTIRSGSQMSMSTGTMYGTLGGSGAVGDLTVVVDMFSSSCQPPQFTAHGQASVQYDAQDQVERLTWTASGTSICAGTATDVDLTCVPGMKKQ